MEKIEQRAVIKHCVGAGMTLVDTLKFMNAGKSCKRGLVYKWHACFSNGRENIADDDRDRRPKTTERLRSRIKEALNEDRRKTIDELADHFDVRHGAVYYIITNKLKMTKVSARWVPRILSEEDKSVRVQTSKHLLERYEREVERFLQSIIKCDESWLHFYDPETKAESMVWEHTSSPPPKKAKVVKPAQKVMFLVFASFCRMPSQKIRRSMQRITRRYPISCLLFFFALNNS